MHDADLVRSVQRFGDLPRDHQRVVHRKGTAGDPGCQRLAFDQFHHQRTHVARGGQRIDLRDVWVVERRESARLALETRGTVRAQGKLARKDLERHVPVQNGVARPIHLAHSATAEQRHHLERAHVEAGGECHAAVGVSAQQSSFRGRSDATARAWP